MARKITIRRVGGLLPAFCLVVFVLLASLFTWLSTAGLPDCAIRRIEEAAAQQGCYLRIGQLKLSPASGLAVRARRVELFAAAGDATPLATLERATLAVSFPALLRGEMQPTKAEFRNLEVSLPTDGEAPFTIREATASATIRKGEVVRLTSASALLEGIPLTVKGSFRLPAQEEDAGQKNVADASPLDLVQLLAEWKDELGLVQRAIAKQKWTTEDSPSITLTLVDAGEKQRLSARVYIPRYDEGQFHFRKANADVEYRDKSIIINKVQFSTVEPDSKVTLQGGYDIPERFLSLNLRSTAALTRMLEAVTIPGVDKEALQFWLSRFQHPDDAPPSISLRAKLGFEEDFSPKSIDVQGEITQRDFTFGKTEVSELVLPFYYRDGDFNLDTVKLCFPTGSVSLTASAFAATGKGKARLIANLDVPHLLQLANEFTESPLSLPEGLELGGNLQLDASAELDMPAFISGSTKLEQFLPALHHLELALSIDKATHRGCELVRPSLKLELNHPQAPEEGLMPRGLEQASLAFSSEEVTLPGREGEEKASTLRAVALNLELQGLTLEEQEGTHELVPHVASASGNMSLGSLALPAFSAEALELHLEKATHIHPLAEDWRHLLQEASLRLSTGAMHSGETLLGSATAELTLDARGCIDLGARFLRESHLVQLDLHPLLTEEGLLILDGVQLELPAAGFAPLLSLAGVNITQILLPEVLTISGNAVYDTRANYLRQAEGTLSIPHLVRTPGARVLSFQGREIPLSVQVSAQATGRESGDVEMAGHLTVVHKTGEADAASPREIKLTFRGDTATHLHLEGTNTMDVGVVDQLIDLHSAHVIMRDFHTHANSRTDVDIEAVDINWADGLKVTAVCHARIRDIGYQMNAYNEPKDANGKPTGKETLRTDFGADPFRKVEKATARVDVLYEEDAAGKVESTRISILDADITYDNRPWIRSQGFRNGVNRSRLQGKAIIIDVEESFVELKEVHGQAYPAYAIGAYYDELPGFMEMLIFRQPVQVETQHCLFPIYSDCKRSMSGSIRLMASRASFRFLGTTFPLTSFSGFVWFKDGAVCLDRLNAGCWDGAINAAVNINYSGKRTGFDGYATLQNINLKPLAAAYDSQQQPALCNGTIRFRTPSSEINDLKAYGELHITDGDLMSLGIFRPVGDLISDLPGNLAALEKKAAQNKDGKPTWIDRQITSVFKTTGNAVSGVGKQVSRVTDNIPFANHFLRYDLQEVHGRFSIGRGKLVTEGMKAVGYNLNVAMQLAIDLNRLTLDGDIWPKITSVPTILLSPITFLSDFLIDIHVYGKLEDVKWKLGLNRKKKKEEEEECSVTHKEAKQTMKPKKR